MLFGERQRPPADCSRPTCRPPRGAGPGIQPWAAVWLRRGACMAVVDFRRLRWLAVLSLVAFAVASAGVLPAAPRVAAAPTPQEGKATVGDIEIAYRIQGQGEPL